MKKIPYSYSIPDKPLNISTLYPVAWLEYISGDN